MSLPTVADLRVHANMSTTVDDNELVNHLDAAVEVVEGLIGPIGVPASVTEVHRSVSSDVIVLRSLPVGSLVSVSSRSGATTTPLTLSDYEIETGPGLLRRVDGGRLAGTYTVVYTSGRAVLPASIHLAVLIIAAHLWETQRGLGPDPRALQDPAGFEQGPVGSGYAIPNRARDLLAAFIVPGVA